MKYTNVRAYKVAPLYSGTYRESTTRRRDDGRPETMILPREVFSLVDGRILARYNDHGPEDLNMREVFFDSANDFRRVHPCSTFDGTGDAEGCFVEAPAIMETFAVTIDWAELHTAVHEMDVARRRAGFGSLPADKPGDVLGGAYWHGHYEDLPGLLTLANATSAIAEAAWKAVHGARYVEGGVEVARQACRVAIACSKVFALLHAAGLIKDPSSRICGTGDGYGLTGLRWLAGSQYDRGCTSEEVEVFAFGGDLPAASSEGPWA